MNVKFIFGLTILSANLHAQTFTVNNLDQTGSTGPIANLWATTSFTTGSEATILQSIVARLSGFDGGNEFISIYNDHETLDQPGTSFITFQDNPEDLGTNQQFRFTPNGTNTLSADTTYWMVFGSNVGGQFNVTQTSSTTETGSAGWSIGNDVFLSMDQGASWTRAAGGGILFQINAIIPEPQTYAFAIGLSLIAFVAFRRMHCEIFKTSKASAEIIIRF